jgi:glutamate-1-semialdehyde 2,1-aminomutase
LFDRHGVAAVISRVGSGSCVYFARQEPADWWDIREHHDADFDARYRRALIKRGIYHFPVMVKQGSISFAHSEADIDRTLEATDDALRELTCGAGSVTATARAV